MDEIISYKMCAVKVRNAKLRNYLNHLFGDRFRPGQIISYIIERYLKLRFYFFLQYSPRTKANGRFLLILP
jgi:hypothetical protein